MKPELIFQIQGIKVERLRAPRTGKINDPGI
jgi:hypothetical protein